MNNKAYRNGELYTFTDLEQAEWLAQQPTQAELEAQAITDLKVQKINSIELNPLAQVTINGITYNGGDSSASAIAGAVQLAQALGELDVKLWDINNTIATYTFDEAMTISAQIAKTYRDTQFAKYAKIAEINSCTTIEELEAVVVLPEYV